MIETSKLNLQGSPPMKSIQHGNVLCLYLVSQLLLNLLQVKESLYAVISGAILQFLCLVLTVAYRRKLENYQFAYLLVLSRIIQGIVSMILCQSELVLLVLTFTQNPWGHSWHEVTGNLAALIIVIRIQPEYYPVAVVLCINVLSMYCFYVSYEKAPQNTYLDSEEGKQGYNPKTREMVWKNKLFLIPIQILMVNKSNYKFTYCNNALQKYFEAKMDPERFSEFILEELQFSIVQDRLEQIQSSAFNIRQRKKQRQAGTAKSIMAAVQIQQQSLRTILQNYESFENYTDTMTQSLELHSDHLINGKIISLACHIILIDNDDDFVICLQDISKQSELQSKITLDDFKTKIINSFSHEMRTPLNSASNFLNCCINDADTPEIVKQQYIVPAITALRLQSYLISDVIDFSQIYANLIELCKREFALSDLITDIQALFDLHFQLKNQEFVVDCLNNTIVYLYTDYNRLLQVLINLIQNAIKFSNGFQSKIELNFREVNDRCIEISVIDYGDGISSSHLDSIRQTLQSIKNQKQFDEEKDWNGFGLLIAQLLILKLSPHENSLTISSRGLGMGTVVSFLLDISPESMQSRAVLRSYSRRGNSSPNIAMVLKQLIVNNNANPSFRPITIKNIECLNEEEEDDDSHILSHGYYSDRVQIIECIQPRLITDVLQQCTPKQKRKTYRGQVSITTFKRFEDQQSIENVNTFLKNKKCICQRLLSVDDEIFNQKSIQILLQTLGFEVILAFNGVQAIDILTKVKKCSQQCCLFNLIIMDYAMPIMDGIEATIQIKKLIENKQIPSIHIVGLTAFTNQTDIQKCIAAGMSDVLSKPLNLREFKEVLSQL